MNKSYGVKLWLTHRNMALVKVVVKPVHAVVKGPVDMHSLSPYDCKGARGMNCMSNSTHPFGSLIWQEPSVRWNVSDSRLVPFGSTQTSLPGLQGPCVQTVAGWTMAPLICEERALRKLTDVSGSQSIGPWFDDPGQV